LDFVTSSHGYKSMARYSDLYNPSRYEVLQQDIAPVREEAGGLRSHVTIPLLKGIGDVGGQVGYALEKISEPGAPGVDIGRSLQESNAELQRTLTARQSEQAQQDAQKSFIDEEGNYGGANLGTISQSLFQSIPSTVAMGAAGTPVAGLLTKAIAPVAGKLAPFIGSGLGFGAAEGAVSAASSAGQLQTEIRNSDFSSLSKHPSFAEEFYKTDDSLSNGERLSLAREAIAKKASDAVFADTLIKTGAISALTGGGVFGAIKGNIAKKTAGEVIPGLLPRMAKGAVVEAGQEAPQSALEQQTLNRAKQAYTDPTQQENEGVLNAGLMGGVTGGVMGLAGGFAGPIRTQRIQPSEPTVDQSQDQPPGQQLRPVQPAQPNTDIADYIGYDEDIVNEEEEAPEAEKPLEEKPRLIQGQPQEGPPSLPSPIEEPTKEEPTFTPTHELSDGTPVALTEGNTYLDAKGEEYQDDYAVPIKQPTEVTRNETNEKNADEKTGEEDAGLLSATPEKIKAVTISKDDIPYDSAYRAYSGISHVPEKRAQQEQDDYVGHMQSAYDDAIKVAKTDEQRTIIDNAFEDYRQGFIKRKQAHLQAKSRVLSPMITGPANFPVRRNEKANQVERKRLDELVEWDNKAREKLKSIALGSRPEAEIAEEKFIAIKKGIESSLATINGIDEGTVKGSSRALFVNNLTGRIKTLAKNENADLVNKVLDTIQDYQKDLKKPLITPQNSIWALRGVEKQSVEKQSGTETLKTYQGAKVVNNFDAGRVQILFDEKPSEQVRSALKAQAFKWSPNNNAWQRQNTVNGIAAGKSVLDGVLQSEIKPQEQEIALPENKASERKLSLFIIKALLRH